MHKHSKVNCIILKREVNDLGLAFVSKVGLGTFWTLVQVLLYHDVVHVSVSSSVSSFGRECITIVRKIYTMMHMQDLIDSFDLINYKQHMTTMKCMVGHIGLDKHIFGIFFLLKEPHVVLHYLFLLVVTVYIFI
jgi:hypothetical protein